MGIWESMRKQSLRSSTGCLRCKNRHHKCDEKHPRCSFCTRYNVKCIWPTRSQLQSDADRQRDGNASGSLNVICREPARDRSRLSLDPFHNMPVHYSDDMGVIADHLYSFFVGITQSTFPFDIATTHEELSRGWLASVYADEAVCSSFVTYCAWFYSKRTTQQYTLTNLSLRNEARSLAILRDRIELHGTVSEGTLLAAALHYFVACLSIPSETDLAPLSCLAQGMYAMITANGGASKIIDTVSSSTLQSLVLVDIFHSLLSAQPPFLGDIRSLPRPSSYDTLYQEPPIDKTLRSFLQPEVVSVLEDMRFALSFRTPSRQTRRLTLSESRYLFTLLEKISYALCTQQSRLLSTQSISEIAILGLIIVKEEILMDVVQHQIMPITILRRLQAVITTSGTSLQGSSLTIAMWASTMALVASSELEEERVWALQFLTTILTCRHGVAWPMDWVERLRKELKRVLWHQTIERAFGGICERVDRLRCRIMGCVSERSSSPR